MRIHTDDGTEIRVEIRIDDITTEEAEALSELINEDINFDNDLEMLELSFTPNPGNGAFNISFDLPNNGNTNIKIVDINGREVYYEDLGMFSGNYSKSVNISEEPAGIYFLFINQEDKQFSKKIIKQ